MSDGIQMTMDEKKALIRQIIMERLRNNTLIESLMIHCRPNTSGWKKWGKYAWLLRDRDAREEIEKQTYEAIDYLESMALDNVIDTTVRNKLVIKEKKRG